MHTYVRARGEIKKQPLQEHLTHAVHVHGFYSDPVATFCIALHWLYQINRERNYTLVPPTLFNNPALSSLSDTMLVKDYNEWKKNVMTRQQGQRPVTDDPGFYLAQFPFLLSAEAKKRLLLGESAILQQMAQHQAFNEGVQRGVFMPFFVMLIDRDHLLQTCLHQVPLARLEMRLACGGHLTSRHTKPISPPGAVGLPGSPFGLTFRRTHPHPPFAALRQVPTHTRMPRLPGRCPVHAPQCLNPAATVPPPPPHTHTHTRTHTHTHTHTQVMAASNVDLRKPLKVVFSGEEVRSVCPAWTTRTQRPARSHPGTPTPPLSTSPIRPCQASLPQIRASILQDETGSLARFVDDTQTSA